MYAIILSKFVITVHILTKESSKQSFGEFFPLKIKRGIIGNKLPLSQQTLLTCRRKTKLRSFTQAIDQTHDA
jgi:hypothetical protein